MLIIYLTKNMNYIVELIIRPARNLYQSKDLGEKVFFYCGQMFKRQDFDTQIRNNRGQRLSCSFWSPNDMNSKELSSVLFMII